MLSRLHLDECDLVAVDLETTGCSPGRHSIIEIGAVRVRAGVAVDAFETLVRPTDPVPRAVTNLTGITPEMLAPAPSLDDAMLAFRTFADGGVLVAHNYRFDLGFLDFEAERLWGTPFPRPALDTLTIARRLHPGLERYSLRHLAERFGASVVPDHRAANDARAAGELLAAMLPDLREHGIITVGDLAQFCGLPDQTALAARLPLASGVPDAPGVYVFRDADGAVLFVGRAKSLRQRIRSHFYPAGDRDHSSLGCLVDSLRAVPAASSLDAALLERRLLARHDPPFNAPVQRPRVVYFLHVDAARPFAGVRVVTSRRRRGVHVGPFTSRWAATVIADHLPPVHGLRLCARRLDARLAALDCAHRGVDCPAPCVNELDPAAYSIRVAALLSVFSGEDRPTRDALAALQEEAAADARYEDAIRYRDALRALERGLGTLSVIRSTFETDAVLVEHHGETVTVHLIRNGLRASVLRGRPDVVADRLSRALRAVYFSDRPRQDILDLTAEQIAEMLAIASFADGDGHIQVPVTDERLTTALIKRSLGFERREPRRRHAAV